ncbi:polyprenyl synthetase family protein [Pelotomaculum isophthalicicum JI]|uniref:Polyprenyl synthetase family protein n=1 Tax=Pelotomaculum isophthalicicum JI TaxID=947010 RepID=A0A9X4H029_9FIRM|nr:polyprenyl synthetase family protein [Pelotomaculum isophthalicicum]MDF9406936.1 polyprenyl synthetase family protein [Pelotomaculum isophthalicicum JI]
MLRTILGPIAADLENVYCILRKEFPLIIGQAGDLTRLEHLSVNTAIRPALVILSSRIYDGNPEKTAVLAAVFQFIYLASKVQENISKADPVVSSEISDYRDKKGFSVLLGDYLYSKSTFLLIESGITGMICAMAEIVCQVHEGLLFKEKLTGFNPASKAFHDIVRKETAELFAGCCLLGARLAGAVVEDQEIMRRFGLNLGMAFGLSELGVAVEQTSFYTENALEYLLLAPARPEKIVLEQLVNMLSGSETKIRRMVG